MDVFGSSLYGFHPDVADNDVIRGYIENHKEYTIYDYMYENLDIIYLNEDINLYEEYYANEGTYLVAVSSYSPVLELDDIKKIKSDLKANPDMKLYTIYAK